MKHKAIAAKEDGMSFTKLPCKDSRVLSVSAYKGFYILFVCRYYFLVGVEQVVRRARSDSLVYIDVHSTIVCPVVGPGTRFEKNDRM
jgi:hypothetical protein